ncbi:ORF-4 [Porcine circovirus type 2-B]|uniref:ORF-4 n=1 Tax=Porcine circovirus type 2-B TaxID=85709 RepID=Q9YQX3_PCV2|nr:ORF-4 [Porcine circovirus type 2-B]
MTWTLVFQSRFCIFPLTFKSSASPRKFLTNVTGCCSATVTRLPLSNKVLTAVDRSLRCP